MKDCVTAYFMCGLYFLGVCDGDSARPHGHPFRFLALRVTVLLFWPAFLILWLGKLFIFYPLLYVSEALGWDISHCGVCGKAR